MRSEYTKFASNWAFTKFCTMINKRLYFPRCQIPKPITPVKKRSLFTKNIEENAWTFTTSDRVTGASVLEHTDLKKTRTYAVVTKQIPRWPMIHEYKISKVSSIKIRFVNQAEVWTQVTRVNSWFLAVYMSYMSQNFRLFHASNLSPGIFRIFLLMYPGSMSCHSSMRRVARSCGVSFCHATR